MTASSTRPEAWREREGSGTFAGWLAPPATEVRLAPVIALVLTAVTVAHPLMFDYVDEIVFRILPSLTFGVFAVVFWFRTVLLLRPPAAFSIENGRITLATGAIPWLSRASLTLGDVARVRPVAREVKHKFSTFQLWDVVVESRDGTTHVVKLSLVPAREASWVAERVTSAVGR
jgi:hypothetical protein